MRRSRVSRYVFPGTCEAEGGPESMTVSGAI
jgi:hypothetical protein